MRNKFIDPRNDHEYEWHINHEDEDGFGRTRGITTGAPTGQGDDDCKIGLVRQQGEMAPFTIRVRGKILHRQQYIEFWKWFQRCNDHSIFWRDFDDQKWEVIITNLETPRHRRLPGGGGDLDCHFFSYEMEMQILAFRGDHDLKSVDLEP